MSGTTSGAYCQQWTTICGATCICDAVFSSINDISVINLYILKILKMTGIILIFIFIVARARAESVIMEALCPHDTHRQWWCNHCNTFQCTIAQDCTEPHCSWKKLLVYNKNTSLQNVNVYYVHCSELGWPEGWHPVEWRDIKTAGEVLPNPLSGQTTHKNWSKKCNRNSSTVNVKPTPFYPT